MDKVDKADKADMVVDMVDMVKGTVADNNHMDMTCSTMIKYILLEYHILHIDGGIKYGSKL